MDIYEIMKLWNNAEFLKFSIDPHTWTLKIHKNILDESM